LFREYITLLLLKKGFAGGPDMLRFDLAARKTPSPLRGERVGVRGGFVGQPPLNSLPQGRRAFKTITYSSHRKPATGTYDTHER
jgi:hypothetical protein